MLQILLFALVAGRLASPKGPKAQLSAAAATPEAEKHQAVLDYEVGEDEAAADPEQPVEQRDAAKTTKLETEISSERTWSNDDEQKADQASAAVLSAERKSTEEKKAKSQKYEKQAQTKQLDEAALDYQCGENAKAEDPEQPDVQRMDKHEDSLEAEVESERKFKA